MKVRLYISTLLLIASAGFSQSRMEVREINPKPLKIDGSKDFRQIHATDDHGIERQPEFPGGMKAFSDYIKRALKFPDGKRLNGRVVVTFIVEKDGSIKEAKAVQKLSPRYDAEAVRVVKASPKWIPAKADRGDGWKPIIMMMSVPIKFSSI